MELWLDLLFGNPVGLMSVLTVLVSLIIIIYLLVMFIRKSGEGR